jgi:threonine dehydrogenase-like Zn-dependent dehydrogenase
MRIVMDRSAFLDALQTFAVPASIVTDVGRLMPNGPITATYTAGADIVFEAPGSNGAVIVSTDQQYANFFNAVQLLANRAARPSAPTSSWLIWGGGAVALVAIVGVWLYARK